MGLYLLPISFVTRCHIRPQRGYRMTNSIFCFLAQGDAVAEDEVVGEIETDKVSEAQTETEAISCFYLVI